MGSIGMDALYPHSRNHIAAIAVPASRKCLVSGLNTGRTDAAEPAPPNLAMSRLRRAACAFTRVRSSAVPWSPSSDSSSVQEYEPVTARLSWASDQRRWPVKCEVSRPIRLTWRLTMRMDPAEVTHRPSSRMTPRHDLEAATAETNWASDHVRLSRRFSVITSG